MKILYVCAISVCNYGLETVISMEKRLQTVIPWKNGKVSAMSAEISLFLAKTDEIEMAAKNVQKFKNIAAIAVRNRNSRRNHGQKSVITDGLVGSVTISSSW